MHLQSKRPGEDAGVFGRSPRAARGRGACRRAHGRRSSGSGRAARGTELRRPLPLRRQRRRVIWPEVSKQNDTMTRPVWAFTGAQPSSQEAGSPLQFAPKYARARRHLPRSHGRTAGRRRLAAFALIHLQSKRPGRRVVFGRSPRAARGSGACRRARGRKQASIPASAVASGGREAAGRRGKISAFAREKKSIDFPFF